MLRAIQIVILFCSPWRFSKTRARSKEIRNTILWNVLKYSNIRGVPKVRVPAKGCPKSPCTYYYSQYICWILQGTTLWGPWFWLVSSTYSPKWEKINPCKCIKHIYKESNVLKLSWQNILETIFFRFFFVFRASPKSSKKVRDVSKTIMIWYCEKFRII